MCEKCGEYFAKKERERKSSERRPKKKGKQEYRVSGKLESPVREYLEQIKMLQ